MSAALRKEKSITANRDRGVAIFAAVLIPLPLLITSTVCSCGFFRWQRALIFLCCGAAAWLLGQLFGFLLKKAGKKGVYLVRIGFILGGIGLVTAYEILFSRINSESLSALFMPMALCFWYWFGYRIGAGQDPVPYVALGIYCAEAAILFPLCGAFEEELHGGRNAILITTAAVTVLGALIINGRQLKRISLRGKSDSGILSAASKRFNVKTTLIFSGVLLFLFFFASFGADLLWEGSKAIVRFFLYLLSLIPKSEGNYEFDPQQGGIVNADPALEGDNLIGQIITAVILAILFICLLKPMIKGAKRLFRNIMQKLGRKAETEENYQYTDIYQASDRREFEKSSFKKAVRAFKKEKDSTLKYRLGYKAFMIFIGEASEQVSRGETTRIHLEKGKALTESPYLEQAVEIYCKVRYDDYIAASEDISVIGNLLKTLYTKS
ncbi:MAG: hypothetical protein NC203_04145 [Firmicutes bacterium]|nr:hypothetical protein [[Eubacterium] siraeum]MCM1487540.1 hypothetical protein [Bacillota bacterium]